MMESMTAFGRAGGCAGGYTLTVEIRSVNNRYLETNVRLPRFFSHLEEKIKPHLQSRGISRGKVDVFITAESDGTQPVDVKLDTAYAEGYVAALRQLRDTFDLPDDISTMTVARNQDIFTVKKAEADTDRDWAALKPVLDEALDVFIAARRAEGKRLEADLCQKLDRIRTILAGIEKTSNANIAGYREKLAARVRDMLADNNISVDESRLLTECALFADKVAIDEEIVRLRSHFAAFDQIRQDPAPAGRKLDFLLQEMNRETNTIGSKSIDADIAHNVVDIKNELEKIREQVQNLE